MTDWQSDVLTNVMRFDSVIFLTWSDWHSEPRSNRYHYAVRFAKHWPVYFVQPDLDTDEIRFESIDDFDITIVHVSKKYGLEQATLMKRAFGARGLRQPLLWIYNPFFEEFIRTAPAVLRVLHATEDYFTGSSLAKGNRVVGAQMLRTLPIVDLLIGVSDGVVKKYIERGAFKSRSLVLRNGCDFEFWDRAKSANYEPPHDGRKVAFYQGAVNARLDFALLDDLTDLLPDWEFWFCGAVKDEAWKTIFGKPNVRSFGEVDPQQISNLARHSLVGLIPFRQDELIKVSLPLKAYEYVACGLPVVSIPIDALAERPDLFNIETTAEGFRSAIISLAQTRTDPSTLDLRRAAAQAASYDLSFAKLTEELAKIGRGQSRSNARRGNVLVLYDDRSTHVSTVREHLTSFTKYSKHRIWYASGSADVPAVEVAKGCLDLEAFDAVAIHYSLRLSVQDHISPVVAEAVRAYFGPKLLFIQDEYDATETARRWIGRLGIDAIFTNVPLAHIERVYPATAVGQVDFLPTLTGYVPEEFDLSLFGKPISERPFVIGYRGRKLPHHYGKMGWEKYTIGLEMRDRALARGFQVDIEVDDHHRIYGDDWYRFLGSCRATLGTESGSNVFDEDGSLAELAKQHSEMTFDAFHKQYLEGREACFEMNQISPKIFEAIRLGTALVLFEGAYSGIIKPNVHYIPLKKDYSNVAEVFEKLADLEFLKTITFRAFSDVIESGRFSYNEFVAGFDAYVDWRMKADPRATLLSSPWLVLFKNNEVMPASQSVGMFGFATDTVLNGHTQRDLVASRAKHFLGRGHTTYFWHLAVFSKIRSKLNAVLKALPKAAQILPNQARYAWKMLPPQLRKYLVRNFDL